MENKRRFGAGRIIALVVFGLVFIFGMIAFIAGISGQISADDVQHAADSTSGQKIGGVFGEVFSILIMLFGGAVSLVSMIIILCVAFIRKRPKKIDKPE